MAIGSMRVFSIRSPLIINATLTVMEELPPLIRLSTFMCENSGYVSISRLSKEAQVTAKMEYPPFEFGKSRFDQGTFKGRLRHLLDITDPRTLFTSEARLQYCIKLLDSFKARQLSEGVTDKDLWEAQKVKQSIIHPDTGEKILMPFRMSGYVPFGTPIVVGMLLPNLTFNQMIFWQWLNQSHNACFNYSNRNATKPTPTSRFIIGYLGAVTSAISIAVGLSKLIKKANAFSPATKMLIQRFVPYPAVASANVCNVLLMRNTELTEGIDVLDSDNNVVGTSKIAAKHKWNQKAKQLGSQIKPNIVLGLIWIQTVCKGNPWVDKSAAVVQELMAVLSTAGTRIVLPAPILIIPPIVMSLLENLNVSASANVCNVLLMRNTELTEGIDVLDSDNNVVGTSKIAAKHKWNQKAKQLGSQIKPNIVLGLIWIQTVCKGNPWVDKSAAVVQELMAVLSTAGTRIVLPAPILIIPPIVMSLLEKTKFLKCNPRMHLPLNAITCTISFGLALPAAVAMFPQYAKIARKDLEPEIQAATSEEYLTFNKGL